MAGVKEGAAAVADVTLAKHLIAPVRPLLTKTWPGRFYHCSQTTRLGQCEVEGNICDSSINKLYTRQGGFPNDFQVCDFYVV